MAREFDIFKKRELPDEAQIVGFTFLKKPKEEESEERRKKKFDFIEKSNDNEIGCMLPKRKAWLAYRRGYVGLDGKENVFVEVKSRLLIIILLFGLLFGLLLGSCFFGGPETPEPLPTVGDFSTTDEQETRPTNPPAESVPSITFAGYGRYTVSSAHPSVELHNPANNFVDMVFTLKDEATGDLIARTDKVPAGKFVYVNVMNYYAEAGVYNILIEVSTFDAESGDQMNGLNQKMEVTVEP